MQEMLEVDIIFAPSSPAVACTGVATGITGDLIQLKNISNGGCDSLRSGFILILLIVCCQFNLAKNMPNKLQEKKIWSKWNKDRQDGRKITENQTCIYINYSVELSSRCKSEFLKHRNFKRFVDF